jgi:hypothetical protein
MAECGRGSVIARPASGSFCSMQVNLTMPLAPLIAQVVFDRRDLPRVVARSSRPLTRPLSPSYRPLSARLR